MGEEERDLIEGEPGKVYPVWERGYRGWDIGFKKGDPCLYPLISESEWEPKEGGEVVSSWKEDEDESFEKTHKGFYSLRKLEEVTSRFPRADIYGAIIPYGKTYYGDTGYRSEKATIDALFRRVKCFVCQKPAEFIIHNGCIFPVCKRCLRRAKNIMEKGRGFMVEEIEDVLQRLAARYEAKLQDFPEQCKE